MNLPKLFLVDLRTNKDVPSVCSRLTNSCVINILNKLDNFYDQLEYSSPDVICFDFDYPDKKSLSMLEKTRYNFPSIPVLMVTQYHDEQLAVWALRARVWDYFAQPVQTEEILSSINTLSSLRNLRPGENSPRKILKPAQVNNIKIKAKFNRNLKNHSFNVIKYVENHYHEKIYISELAKQCQISIYQFSRVFKREKGITFRDYLIKYRLNKACELLQESILLVGDVGFAVGFSDHSYFTRVFKQHVGVSPSDYRLDKN